MLLVHAVVGVLIFLDVKAVDACVLVPEVINSHERPLVEVFDGNHSRALNDGTHRIALRESAWRWYRVGAADTTLRLSSLDPERLQ